MIVGLTGGIGSGKSEAGKFFYELGIEIIDADDISKNILDTNINARETFIKKFGDRFLGNNDKINRSLLREEIFRDINKKELLESIIHPVVKDEIIKFVHDAKSIYKIIMVPLIFETNSQDFYDKIIVVDCDPEFQVDRASKRDRMPKENIDNIIKSQASRDERLSIADIIIKNNSDIEALRLEVYRAHQKLLGIEIE